MLNDIDFERRISFPNFLSIPFSAYNRVLGVPDSYIHYLSTSSCCILKNSLLQIYGASTLDPHPIYRRNGKRSISTRRDIKELDRFWRRCPRSISFRLLRPLWLVWCRVASSVSSNAFTLHAKHLPRLQPVLQIHVYHFQ